MKYKIVLYTLFILLPVIANAQISGDEQLALQFYQNKEYDKAAVLYEKLYNKKNGEFYYLNYLNCLIELKEFKKAEDLAKKQIKRLPDNPIYAIDLGYIFQLAGDNNKAVQQFEKILKNLPLDYQQIINTANAFSTKQETDYAVKTYMKGRKLLNNNALFNFELADIYAMKKDIPAMFNEYLEMALANETYLQNVQNALSNALANDVANKKNEYLKALLIKRIQENPDKSVFTELLIWHYIQQKEFDSAFIQSKALDKKLKEDGTRMMNLASISASNNQYDVAIKTYQYVISKGKENHYYISAKMDMVEVMNTKITESSNYTPNDLTDLEKTYLSSLEELGKNARTIPLIRGLAHLEAFYLYKMEDAIALLNECITLPNVSNQELGKCKLELGDILLLTGEIWETTLLYSQVEKMFKNEPMGQEAKLRNAKLSYYTGEFDWAEAQLNVLKSATSQFIANDALYLALLISDNTVMDTTTAALEIFARADLLAYQNKLDLALTALDSITQFYPNHTLVDDILFEKAQIYYKRSDFENTIKFYKEIADKYSTEILGDDAFYRLALIYDHKMKDQTKAMEYYQELLIKYPGSLYTVEARKRFRELRGDNVN